MIKVKITSATAVAISLDWFLSITLANTAPAARNGDVKTSALMVSITEFSENEGPRKAGGQREARAIVQRVRAREGVTGFA
jgi:hypothetical protein